MALTECSFDEATMGFARGGVAEGAEGAETAGGAKGWWLWRR